MRLVSQQPNAPKVILFLKLFAPECHEGSGRRSYEPSWRFETKGSCRKGLAVLLFWSLSKSHLHFSTHTHTTSLLSVISFRYWNVNTCLQHNSVVLLKAKSGTKWNYCDFLHLLQDQKNQQRLSPSWLCFFLHSSLHFFTFTADIKLKEAS